MQVQSWLEWLRKSGRAVMPFSFLSVLLAFAVSFPVFLDTKRALGYGEVLDLFLFRRSLSSRISFAVLRPPRYVGPASRILISSVSRLSFWRSSSTPLQSSSTQIAGREN